MMNFSPCSSACDFVVVVCMHCDGHVLGEVAGKHYGNGDQGQWDVALEALMALLSADLGVTQEKYLQPPLDP